MQLTVELQDSLLEQLHNRQVSDGELKSVAIAALEIWLAQQHDSTNGGRFSESAVTFIRQLISENPELFEALARR